MTERKKQQKNPSIRTK